jgi:PAS domain S-box-containing protein
MFEPRPKSFSNLLGALFLSIVFVFIVCGALYQREANQITTTALNNEGGRMERFAALFRSDMSNAVSDLRIMATGDGILDYLETGRPADLDRAARRAIFISKDNVDYDKIRYIDEKGVEIMRVNADGQLVPNPELQNKSDRQFFKNANALSPGELYLSAIDLNTEHDAIEVPFKPTVRLAVPLFDAKGQRRGIYIINYLIAHSIDRIVHFVPQYAPRFRLLNSQGYWLRGAKPEDEWGFMVPERSNKSLAKTDPALWARVVREPFGQVPYQGGYFTWLHVVPGDFVQGKPVKLISDDDFIIFASQITATEWASILLSLRQTFVLVGCILLYLTVVIVRGLHERRLAQLERDRFFSLTRDLLCVAGFDGYFRRVNPAWEESLGFTVGEMISKPFLDFVHPEDREKTALEAQRLAKGRETLLFENRYRCKDGSYRWLLWNARPLVEEKLIYCSARDLTERKRIEESLRQSEIRSRSIIESAHDAFVTIDQAGRILDWNLRAEAVFGWSRAEAIGKFLHDTIIPPQHREAHRRGMAHLKATGEGPVLNRMLELTALRRSGEEFPVEFVIWPLKMGNETTFHAFVRDITVRRDSEDHIKKLNAELKLRADLLEVANSELESFSYSVSHDLRAPLRHINGFVEMLLKSPTLQADQTSRHQMDIISRAAKGMGRLIDDLLALSRTGRAEMHPLNVNMNDMVRQILQERALECAARQIDWRIQPLAEAMGDPGLLRLVWANLIDNAIKYTRLREVAVIEIGNTVSSANGTSANEIVYFVRDNGVGFDMQYSSKLFGVFQRLHSSDVFEGTGIGLANVQRIIRRHGGRVWAEAQVDVGATFYFSLPSIIPQPVESNLHGQNQTNPPGRR